MNPKGRDYPFQETGPNVPQEEVLRQPADAEAVEEMRNQIQSIDELARLLPEWKKTHPQLIDNDQTLAELAVRLDSEITDQERFIQLNEESSEFSEAVADARNKLESAQLIRAKILAPSELDNTATVGWVIRNTSTWQPGLRYIISEGIDHEPQAAEGQALSADQLRIKYQFAHAKAVLLERAAQPLFAVKAKWFSGELVQTSDVDTTQARADITKANLAQAQVEAARKQVEEISKMLRNQRK